MKPKTPRALALDLLLRVEEGAKAQFVLDQALDRLSWPERDKAYATHLVYGALRRLYLLDFLLEPHLPRPERLPKAIRWTLRLGALEWLLGKEDHARVHPWVEEAKARHPQLAGLVNAVLRRLRPREAPPWVRLSLPEWLLQAWQGLFGDLSFAEALNEPAPLFVTAYREVEGLPPGPLPGSYPWPGPKADFPALGLQPQNPASLFAAKLLEALPGEKVLDLCGGAGLKAFYLASRGAEVVSYDLNPKRQAAGRKTAERLGLKVAYRTQDLRAPLGEKAPKVLLDAPCTGTGTLRAHPELRYRLAPEAPKEMARLQRALLETAAAAVEEGGVLVYAVCALTEEEGEGVVRAFLEDHPEFTPEPFSCPLPVLRAGLGVYVAPLEGLDGFYYARLRRAKL